MKNKHLILRFSPRTQTSSTITAADANGSPCPVTFDPDPVKAGYTNPVVSSTLKIKLTATVTPPEDVNKITLMRGGVTPGRINLDNQQKHPADGTITVDVLGRILTPASYKDADTRVLAIKDGKVICSVPVWVLIPRAIGRPHQEPSGSVRGENVCLDKNSSPAYWGSLAPNQVVLETCWDQWLTMRVVDQFGTSLISLYDGQPVKEIVDGQGSWLSINQSISGGTYLDPVGVFQFKNDSTTPYIVLRNSTEAQNWASAPLATFPVGDVWASVKVQVAGHEVGRVGTKGNIIWPGIAIPRRDIITTAPDNVEIVWP